LVSIAQLAISNEFYNTALEILDYIINKGSGSRYYFASKKSQLEIKNKLLSNSKEFSQEEILELERLHLDVLLEFGENDKSAEVMIDLSHLQAFYLNKTEDAINRLNKILEMGNITHDITNNTKIELADIYLYDNNIWEAALLYAQVEKANDQNPIGHEAKLRKAKLAYYSGDFLWAQAQLDVLKASTSKLISNDAFELSMLINENTALDTSVTAMKMFSRADFLIYRDKTDDALSILDSIQVLFPNHSLADNIIFQKGEIMLKKKDFDKAAEFFKEVYDNHGYDMLGDNALFKLAQVQELNLSDTESAMKSYEVLLNDYPGSIFAVEARKRFRSLRGDDPVEESESDPAP